MDDQIKRSGSNILAGLDASKMQKVNTPTQDDDDAYEQQYLEDMAKMCPCFRLNSEQVPWIKNYQVGKKYKLVLEVQVDSIREEDMGNSKVMRICDLNVTSVAGMG